MKHRHLRIRWWVALAGAAVVLGAPATVQASTDEWQQLTSVLAAPAGTQSALFDVASETECEDYCWMEESFDELDVEDTATSSTAEGALSLAPPATGAGSVNRSDSK